MTPSIDLTAVSKRLQDDFLREQRDWIGGKILNELRRCNFRFEGRWDDFLPIMLELGWDFTVLGVTTAVYAPGRRMIAYRKLTNPSVWY